MIQGGWDRSPHDYKQYEEDVPAGPPEPMDSLEVYIHIYHIYHITPTLSLSLSLYYRYVIRAIRVI